MTATTGHAKPAITLRPLDHHQALITHLETIEPDLWAWCASQKAQQETIDAIQLELLKTTVRLSRDNYSEQYAHLDRAAAILDINAELTLYQAAQSDPTPNAALWYTPRQAHIVLQGTLSDILETDELRAVLAHELSHYHLWELDEGRYWTAHRMLNAMVEHPRLTQAQLNTARRCQLYTELYADRGAALVSNSVAPVIRGLIKVQSTLESVDIDAYLKQAEEILQRESGNTSSEGYSHPETFIRALALKHWHQADADTATDTGADNQADAFIQRLINGQLCLEELDLLQQSQLQTTTQHMIAWIFSYPWMKTDVTLAHAKQFFPLWADNSLHDAANTFDKHALTALITASPKLNDYWLYLLLDFAVADGDLDETGLLMGLLIADTLECRDAFRELARKEIKVTKKLMDNLWQDRDNLLQKLMGDAK